MSDQAINYEAVLADLESRKTQIEAAITGIRLILGQAGTGSPSGPPGGGGHTGATPAHDAFIGLSIPEAAKKHLTAVRKKLSTQELMAAMEAGGLAPSKYNTVYAILRRREYVIGDIINMKGYWGLAEWYPNHRRSHPAMTRQVNREKMSKALGKKIKPLLRRLFFRPPRPSRVAGNFTTLFGR
jgi:hypothetical protein